MMYVVGEKKIDRDESSDSVYSSEIIRKLELKRPKDVQKVQVEALTFFGASELRWMARGNAPWSPPLLYRLLYASFLELAY